MISEDLTLKSYIRTTAKVAVKFARSLHGPGKRLTPPAFQNIYKGQIQTKKSGIVVLSG